MTKTHAFLLLSLPWLSGCMIGMDSTRVRMQGIDHGPGSDVRALSFNDDGRPRIYERPLDLPLAREDARYGLVLVDTRSLPAAWRPGRDALGGVTVSAIAHASPLAREGLRSGDVIESVDAIRAEDPEQVVELLTARDHVSLTVRRAVEGRDAAAQTFTVEADAEEDLRDTSLVALPGLFGVATSNTGTGVSVGPLGALWGSRHMLVTDGERFVERTEWGFLLDWFAYRSETDLETGETRRRFTLLWFIDFGDGDNLF